MPAPDSQTFLRELDKKLWTAADRLRSNLDAAVYKHAVLGYGVLETVASVYDRRMNPFRSSGSPRRSRTKAIRDGRRPTPHAQIDPANLSSLIASIPIPAPGPPRGLSRREPKLVNFAAYLQ